VSARHNDRACGRILGIADPTCMKTALRLTCNKKDRTMSLEIAVGIPTVGRAKVLCETLREIGRQTRIPERIIICGTKAEDMEGAITAYPEAQLLVSPSGLPRQRNTILNAADDADIVVFFDDDFFPSNDYLKRIEDCMVKDPSVVVATGNVIADGIGGPGLTFEHARAMLAADNILEQDPTPTFSGYGCNMAVRMAPVWGNQVFFDERLPLYAWQEDVDFSRRLAPFGPVVQVMTARGVHLGVKVGRNSGVRLGYSQVANPVYLARKHSGYPVGRACNHILRNLAMNVTRSFWPETFVDRRGRLRGNLLAFSDLIRGRSAPERILDL
jgi:GT2 family glycosyltransferase